MDLLLTLIVSTFACQLPVTADLIPAELPADFNQNASWGNTRGQLVNMVANYPEVARELVLSDEIRERANTMVAEGRKFFNDLYNIKVPGSKPINLELRKMYVHEKRQSAVDLEFVALLTPEQQKRLAQLYAHESTTTDLFGARLAHAYSARELKLTEVQMREVAKRAVANENAFLELVHELEQEMVKIQTDLRAECERSLTPKQRQELNLLFGRPFYFESSKTGLGSMQLLSRKPTATDAPAEANKPATETKP